MPFVFVLFVSMDLAGLAAMCIGLIHVGTNNGDVAQHLIMRVLESSDAELEQVTHNYMMHHAISIASRALAIFEPGIPALFSCACADKCKVFVPRNWFTPLGRW